MSPFAIASTPAELVARLAANKSLGSVPSSEHEWLVARRHKRVEIDDGVGTGNSAAGRARGERWSWRCVERRARDNQCRDRDEEAAGQGAGGCRHSRSTAVSPRGFA